MDMIKEYESDSPTSEENNDIFVPARELNARSVRKVYLITYSQVDKELFPTRRSFVDVVLQSFNDANVVQWCCSLEQHISAGVHYHMAIKLDRNKRWISSKRLLQESCGISVHFSEIHSNYYSAWKYGYESRRASKTDVFVLIFALSRDRESAHFQTIMASIE